MILHITPDYTNKPLYHHLFEAICSQNTKREQYIYACDNQQHAEQYVSSNVRIVEKQFSVLERFLFYPKQNYLLHDIEKNVPLHNIRIVHAHTLFSSGYTAYQLYLKYGIPYIVAIRNTDVNVFFKYMPHLRLVGQKIAQNAQKIIFLSPAYKKYVIEKYLPTEIANKAIVIPNGIDPLFLENISQHAPHSDTIRLIYIGRIEKEKNIDTIIKTADKLITSGEKVQLCLVGKICQEKYKIEISKRNYITWHDHCSSRDVLNYLRGNEIFIMPSYHETFGLVYAEAMSQGLPVIYSKGQGFDGFFEDGYVGYSTQPDDIDFIAKKIIHIRNHYTEFSTYCVNHVNYFDWHTIAKEYNNIYDTILNNESCLYHNARI